METRYHLKKGWNASILLALAVKIATVPKIWKKYETRAFGQSMTDGNG
jgi:hypothetical protein